MQSSKVRVKGGNVRELVKRLPDNLKQLALQPREDVYVFFSEKYYLRNNSDLMACIVITIHDEENCEVDIVAGAGGAGISQLSLGAEEKEVDKIIKVIKELCQGL